MASSGWIRVATGFQKVASVAAKQASQDAGAIATRAAQHGVDMAANLRNVSAMQQAMHHPPPPSAQPTRGFPNGENAPSKQDRQDPSFSVDKPPMQEQNKPPRPPINGYMLHATKQEESVEQKSPPVAVSDPNLIHAEKGKTDAEPSSLAPENQIRTNNTSNAQAQQQYRVEEDEHINYQRLKEGRAVPSTRVGRAFGFASLGVGLAMGAVGEGLKRLTGTSNSSNILVNDGNSERLAQSLCRMRGAALKMGQMLSIQDESLLPPELTRALQQVRQGADAMPEYQLKQQLQAQLGDNWQDKFESFDMLPFAAASVGQCHRAKLKLSDGTTQNVVVKVQYPGVGRSIESDLSNLSMLVTWTGLAPKGLFLDNVIRVGTEELKVECDYQNEMKNQQRMRDLVESDPILQENKFIVPAVFPDVTTDEVITTAYVPGGTIDKVMHLDQEERNRIARTIMYLTIQELFVWRFMQTDPNWGNFLYDVGSQTTSLIDFGATREYSKEFVDGYLRIVWASTNMDEERLMDQSYRMGFLTGEENDIMLHAHKQSGYTLGEPFRKNEPFDFQESNISTRMGEHSSTFLKHRLT